MDKKHGGLAARKGEGPLWRFTEKNDGSFTVPDADYISRLFFPLINRQGMKCSVTPELKGDICSDFNHYLTIPSVTEDFHRVLNNRNVWIRVEGYDPWSVPGVSVFEKMKKWKNEGGTSTVKGEVGAFTLESTNQELGLTSKITLFVPSASEFVEISKIEVENISDKAVEISLTAATPLYGRTADNVRDHRNVTSMFVRNHIEKHGVRIRPIINFNEHGHSTNHTSYFVLGCDQYGDPPGQVWGAMRDFLGEGGTLDNPESVFKYLAAPADDPVKRDGFEAVGAFRFKETSLGPREKKSFIVMHGIADDPDQQQKWLDEYGTLEKADKALQETLDFWQDIVNQVEFETDDANFNNWMRWNVFQLICRQVYGNSYLPDFGYGRGGRGWRDLWSDLLSIFLVSPESARQEIVNNFNGVRVDGTNATIVGTKPGEFKADRNNVPRTWCDHGSWPVFVVDFYIQQTGDHDILFTEIPYWKDVFIYRSKKQDLEWTEDYGHKQKTESDDTYIGSLFEHMLLQQLCTFFNVGRHNNILLEGGDWNDTYDMARNNGESVCFYNWYGANCKVLADLLRDLRSKGTESIRLLSEAMMLLDSIGDNAVDYLDPEARKKRLFDYYETVAHNVSGKKTDVPVEDLIKDLERKQQAVFDHIRKNEYIKTDSGDSFYNGHYDDATRRVHGDHPNGVRIDLTSQVLPTIFGVATDKQVPEMYKSVIKYLRDENTGGLRLCSNFKEDKLYFGRVTGFVYGHKEHGGKWMQQNIMYLYGLYRRGFVKEAWEVYKDVYNLVMNSDRSKIFPCTPSYFEMDGHGAYSYLTGSPTWLILALVTQSFGIRGDRGDLYLNPKLVTEQFGRDHSASIVSNFRGLKIRVIYNNRNNLDWDRYTISSVAVNGKESINTQGSKGILIPFKRLEELCDREVNDIEVELN